jgi:hypothetical protein
MAGGGEGGVAVAGGAQRLVFLVIGLKRRVRAARPKPNSTVVALKAT